jgi:DNA-binding CsgD family transcriptional regulator
MITLPGYRFVHLVYEDDLIWICYAYSEALARVVLWKMVKEGSRAMIENAKLIHEYETLALLDMERVLKPRELLRQGGSMVLIFEIINGIVLRQYMDAGKIEMSSFLSIAVGICEVLDELHRRELLHMNIRPDTILLVEDTMEVWLTGFSESVPFRQSLHATRLEGNPPYMAPERLSGSRNMLDGRTDLYSLGVTFYEMLTGELPFRAQEPLEWAHAHMAIEPSSLTDQAGVPRAFAAVVDKLLAKTPESRYRTAAGLKADLLRCREQLERTGEIRDFELGAKDEPAWAAAIAIQDEESAVPYPDGPPLLKSVMDEVAAISPPPIRRSGASLFSDSGYVQMLDLNAVFKASHVFATEPDGRERVRRLLAIVLEQAGASRGCWIAAADRGLTVTVSAESAAGRGLTFRDEWVPLVQHGGASPDIVRYAASSRQVVCLADISRNGTYTDTDYVKTRRPKAVLCLPLQDEGQTVGFLYMENHLSANIFSPEKFGVLHMLAMQVFYAMRLTNDPAASPVLYAAALAETASETGLLSARELEVLQLMASGLSNREIAEQLSIAKETVKVHARNLYDKLSVNRRIQAVEAGRRLGLIR